MLVIFHDFNNILDIFAENIVMNMYFLWFQASWVIDQAIG